MGEKTSAWGLHWLQKKAGYSCAVPGEDKDERVEALLRTAELEFAQERARWERDREKHRRIRLLSFSLLSLVVLGALIALFLAFSRANEMRSEHGSAHRSAPAPRSSP